MGRSGEATLVLCFLLEACSVTELAPQPEPIASASTDERTLRRFRLLALSSDALDALVEEELPFSTIGESASTPTVDLQATDGMVRDLENSGRFLRLPESVSHIRKPLSEPCFDIPTPLTSDYLWGYESIREYAYSLAHADMTGRVQTMDIGPTQTGSHAIVSIRFGPPPTVINPPTIYVIATQHAREWGAAGTAVGLMRELAKASTTNYRPSLSAALETSAIVIVPVANPDGYEFSRTTKRSQRGNRNLAHCSLGVDLNRNHPSTWAVPASSMSLGCSESFIGPGAGSESETRALDALIHGGAFPTNQPVVALDYHTYSDLVVFPLAFKATTDSNGPACNGMPDMCLLADHQALRQLLGDTEQRSATRQLFIDDAFAPAEPFRRDQAPNILYTSSGTLIDEAAYGPQPILSATIELFGAAVDFGIECEDKRDDLIRATVARQVDVIEHLLIAAPGLVPGSTGMWIPQHIGQLASGVIHREYAGGMQSIDARPEFSKPTWITASRGRTLKAWIGASQVSMLRTRKGAHYELFSAPIAKLSGDPLHLPCEFRTELEGKDQFGLDVIPECLGREVDLCDSRRLQASDWELVDGDRGGAHDCWWEPRSAQAELVVGGYDAPFASSHCTFSFSYLHDSFPARSIQAFAVERELPSGVFETLWADAEAPPRITSSGQTRRLITLFFEANSLLASGRTPRFRLRVSDTSAFGLKVFDPIVLCRVGSLP